MTLRIAMVIDPWHHPYNGTVVSTRRFAFALARAGREVRLLHIGDQGPEDAVEGITHTTFSRLSIPGVNRIIDTMRAPLARPDRRRIREALAGTDLLHVQFPFFLGHAAIAEARAMGLPVVCSFHVQPENILRNLGISSTRMRELLYRLFVARFYERADLVVAPSAFAAELLHAHGVRRPVAVVSNGVPQAFLAVGEHRETRGPAVEEKLDVLSVGRLAAEKHHDLLLAALARSRFADRIELRLAGAGPKERDLVTRASTLGVRARIGPADQLALLGLYRAADLFVHCGVIELEGMSVLEAMAAGLPVVVADSPDSACARFVTGEWARFRSGDVEDLTRRIDHWLADREARLREGEANHRYAAAHSHERSVDRLLAVYRELLGVAAAAPQRHANGTRTH